MDRYHLGGVRAATRGRVRATAIAPLLSVLLGSFLLSGCMANVPVQPLRPRAVFQDVQRARTEPEGSGPLTLAEATRLLRSNNPAIREARAAYAVELAVARTPTPRPNPTIMAGPLLLGPVDVLSTTVGAIAGLGWNVLLADTPGLTNRLNAVRAHAAFCEAASVERREYLLMRGAFSNLVLESVRLEAVRRNAKTAEDAQQLMSGLVEAGTASALDVSLLDLRVARRRAEVIEGEEALWEARGRFAGRVGVSLDSTLPPAESTLPTLPDDTPTSKVLEDLALAHHPTLVPLRAQYLVAEKQLRLELGNQYPTLDLGFGYESEERDWFGFPISIELPIFDRNQPAIARACARRRELRQQFAARLTDTLADIEAARARVDVRRRRYEMMTKQVQPAAENTVKIGRESLAAGSADALRLNEYLRQDREVVLASAEARLSLYAAWSDLEQACGTPLVKWPNEPGGDTPPQPPPPPSNNENDNDSASKAEEEKK